MMKDRSFKLGDKVAILDEAVNGTIIKINNEHIVILTDDDFEYECRPNEIIINSNLQELLDDTKTKISKHKKPLSLNKNHKIKNRSAIPEVDLHIHELISSEKGMSNFEMLSIQLKLAKSKLEQAIKNKNQRIVFIHGIGAGVLKMELYKLFRKYPVEFYDASYQKYGQGATEVYIFQNKK